MYHRPKKAFGQNFLRDTSVTGRIVTALDIQPGELVVEIGPGEGALTAELLNAGACVTAIEFDRDLVRPLNDRFRHDPRFRLVNADALTITFADLIPEPSAKMAANLPYNISTAILQRLIGERALFTMLVLMFQRELVDRITAGPDDPDRGFLTVLVEDAFRVERLFDVPPSAFFPHPKVWSSVVRLTPKESNVEDQEKLRELLSASFAQRRKTLQNNLKGIFPDIVEILNVAGIDPSRRPQTLTLQEWSELLSAVDASSNSIIPKQ